MISWCWLCSSSWASLSASCANPVSYTHLLIVRQLQPLQDLFIALHHLAGRKPHRDLCLGRMVLDQVHDCMDPPVDPFLLFTEVHLQRLLLVSGHMDCMADQLLDPCLLYTSFWALHLSRNRHTSRPSEQPRVLYSYRPAYSLFKLSLIHI